MPNNEFHRPFSVDFAPQNSRCEWCGSLAERRLTAIGGSYHNESGVFCHDCGEQFAQVVVNAVNVQEKVQSRMKAI